MFVAGVIGFANHAAYAASKHGVIGLTRTAALEYAGKGIRVNALIAGDAGHEARIAAANPTGRLGTPGEVASAIAYLCSDGAAFITGHARVADGGLSAG